MAKTATNISLDADVKREAVEILSALGLDLSTAVGIFLRKVNAVGGIPFDVRIEQPNEETLEAIAEVKALKTGKVKGKSYTSVDEMMEDLLK